MKIKKFTNKGCELSERVRLYAGHWCQLTIKLFASVSEREGLFCEAKNVAPACQLSKKLLEEES